MKPAFSVILLTTLIGAAQGLLVAVYGADVAGRLGFTDAPGRGFVVTGAAIAVVLAALGLLASFWHLGRPERAWRAATMWRTSWLSREVIVLPGFLATTFAYGAGSLWGAAWTPLAGALALACCVALFVCTGMIYACLRFLQEWASPLTVLNFTLLGCASGFTLATALAAFGLADDHAAALGTWAIGLAATALAVRAAMLARNARLRPRSTLQSATGVRHPRLAQTSQGLMGGSFNTREFMHGRSRAFLRGIKWAFLVLAFPVPVLMLFLGLLYGSVLLLVAAFIVQYAGLLCERWFFFAQANHPQNLYYQVIS
ncbi:MAG: dimethyl sulfoxide reductase anchor subunit family protein [Pseudomonadota bacterium]|jgi:DMSO reductase anchor subunit